MYKSIIIPDGAIQWHQILTNHSNIGYYFNNHAGSTKENNCITILHKYALEYQEFGNRVVMLCIYKYNIRGIQINMFTKSLMRLNNLKDLRLVALKNDINYDFAFEERLFVQLLKVLKLKYFQLWILSLNDFYGMGITSLSENSLYFFGEMLKYVKGVNTFNYAKSGDNTLSFYQARHFLVGLSRMEQENTTPYSLRSLPRLTSTMVEREVSEFISFLFKETVGTEPGNTFWSNHDKFLCDKFKPNNNIS